MELPTYHSHVCFLIGRIFLWCKTAHRAVEEYDVKFSLYEQRIGDKLRLNAVGWWSGVLHCFVTSVGRQALLCLRFDFLGQPPLCFLKDKLPQVSHGSYLLEQL